MGARNVFRRIGTRVGNGVAWLERRPGLAGWASAFAAVVAMGLTLWLAYSTSNQTEAQAVAAAVNYGRQAAAASDAYERAIVKFSGNVWEANENVRSAVLERERQVFITLDGVSYDIFMLGHSLRIDQLPPGKIPHFMSMRIAVAEGVTMRARFRQGAHASSGGPLSADELRQYAESCKTLSQRLRDALSLLERA